MAIIYVRNNNGELLPVGSGSGGNVDLTDEEYTTLVALLEEE